MSATTTTTTAMSSPLHSTMTTTTTTTTTTASSASSPAQKKMSITQTYYLAHKARAKLSREAARPDHNLRLLVGHANMLDSLMLELADAEREQESWFNQSVRSASPAKKDDRHVQWADAVPQEDEDWDSDSDSSSDEDSDFDSDEDVEMADAVSLTRVPSHAVELGPGEADADEEDYAHLTLTRSPSHSASPPELDHDLDSSEDESMPPSPPITLLPAFTDKQQRESAASATHFDDKDQESFYDQGFYLPPRNPARLASAISVY